MTLTTQPPHPLFGAEVTDFDLRKPLGDADIADIRAAMNRYAVLVFRNETPLIEEVLEAP